VFGRGGEEAEALKRAGIPYEIVPGGQLRSCRPCLRGYPLSHRACAVQRCHCDRLQRLAQPRSNQVERACAERGHARYPHGTPPFERDHEPAFGRRMRTSTACGVDSVRHSPVAKERCRNRCDHCRSRRRTKFHSPTVVIAGEVVKLGRDLHWFSKAVFEDCWDTRKCLKT
jgi:uroporphyrinogen III methyltransferase / synthase